VALRVLARCLAAAGDEPAATVAGSQAVALAEATQMRAERDASERTRKQVSRR
jgi:hypothetical protein